MAKTSKIAKQAKKAKYSTRRVNRCKLCGRPRGYIRMFDVCRLCFRKLAHTGQLPGVTKASW